MSKRSRRRKQRTLYAPQPSKVLFTFGAVRMIKDALCLMDETFARNTKPLPNLELGHETLESLKTKLDDMLQCEDWNKETPFDYNELHILYAAIHMYLIKLSLADNQQLMPTCLQLYKQFSAVISSVPSEQLKGPV